MDRRRFKVACAAILGFVLGAMFYSRLALADDAALGRAGSNVMPVYDSPVRMVAEVVNIDLKTNTVDAVFTFENTGPAGTVLMGFPMLKEEPYSPDRADKPPKPYFGYQDFRAYEINDDGAQRQLRTEERTGLRPAAGEFFSKWVVFEVRFDKGQTRQIRNTYRAEYAYRNSIGGARLEYVLTTGATWKGTIGRAEINVRFAEFAPGQILHASPSGYKVERDRIHWVFEDLDPAGSEDNIVVELQGVDGYMAYMWSDKALEQWAEDPRFAAVSKALSSGDSASVIAGCRMLLGQLPRPAATVPVTEAQDRLYNQRATLLSVAARHYLVLGDWSQAIDVARQYYREAREFPGGGNDLSRALEIWIRAGQGAGLTSEVAAAVDECSALGVRGSFFREWALAQASGVAPAPSQAPPANSIRNLWERLLEFFRRLRVIWQIASVWASIPILV